LSRGLASSPVFVQIHDFQPLREPLLSKSNSPDVPTPD
jgi:hypothetical protein